MSEQLEDTHLVDMQPLIAPRAVKAELPMTEQAAELVSETRQLIRAILHGRDQRRLLVVTGPCSIHDAEAAYEYAGRLKKVIDATRDRLVIVMRTYFEKPRTTVGWKGLINDPNLDGKFNINKGLRTARGLLLELANMGVPAGSEFLDTITPQFTADLVSWGAIGARTAESQVHRELASGLSMPVGFKNGTGGSIQIAIDGVRAARHPHHFLGVTDQGTAAIISTSGNASCHVILRGSNAGPNYDRSVVDETAEALHAADLPHRILVDCSHGNSQKDYRRQPDVCDDVCAQVAAGSDNICGVMMESHLVAGRQDIKPDTPLTYGQSVTDACIDWETTVPMLEDLARAAAARRC